MSLANGIGQSGQQLDITSVTEGNIDDEVINMGDDELHVVFVLSMEVIELCNEYSWDSSKMLPQNK